MIRSFKTESGSVYLVDQERHRIQRQLAGSHYSARIGEGEWKDYVELGSASGGNDVLTVGEAAVIIWGNHVAPLDPSFPDAMKTTITSFVVSIEEE